MNSENHVEQVEQASKILRNCRKIEHRIYQLEKQLYLGHTQAYNILMKIIYPNYEEHREQMRAKHIQSNLSEENVNVLDKVEKEISNGKRKK